MPMPTKTDLAALAENVATDRLAVAIEAELRRQAQAGFVGATVSIAGARVNRVNELMAELQAAGWTVVRNTPERILTIS